MELNKDTCYQALLAHDHRFDGVFFVGVSTTKIYCRPVCVAKTPNPTNCTFYRTTAAAEREGYRPCLRCRPELAPGNAQVDATSRLAARVASRIEDGALSEGSLQELATELGVTDRHLRRVVEKEFGVTPVELAQTSRLLLAKRLLTDTSLPVVEVAFASGFSSLRRFNALFKERYRLNPTELRKGHASDRGEDTLACELSYSPPLDWEALRTFLCGRSSQGMEAVEGEGYLRTVGLGKHKGWIQVLHTPEKNTLCVRLSSSLAPALQPVLARVKRLFDLSAQPQQIASHLGTLATGHPGLRLPSAFEGYEMAIRAILGQQITVKAATTLAGRFVRAFGEPIETPYPALTHLYPCPEQVACLEPEALIAQGIITTRARSILALSRAVSEGRISLNPPLDVERTLALLQELPGIGEWTAQVIAMRGLGWPDAFPHTDLGIRKAMKEDNPKRILEIAEAWRPWRAYAAMHLWKSLEN